MKRIFVYLILITVSINVLAQDADEKKGGFKRENLFTGGGLNLGFSNGVTALGIDPVFGYSINRIVDVGVLCGVNYTALRYNGDRYYFSIEDNSNYVYTKERLTVIGPGVFTRIFPIEFLFVQAQYEHNFIKNRLIDDKDRNPDITFRNNVNSLLVGAGYCSGREGVGGRPFFYLSVLFDVAGNKDSPYTDQFDRVIPIIKGGIQVPLFQGRRGRY